MLEGGDEKRKSKIYEEDREVLFAERAKNCGTRKPKQFTITIVKTYLLWKPWAEP